MLHDNVAIENIIMVISYCRYTCTVYTVQPINTIDSINCLSITLPAPGEGRLDRYIVITTLDAPQ